MKQLTPGRPGRRSFRRIAVKAALAVTRQTQGGLQAAALETPAPGAAGAG